MNKRIAVLVTQDFEDIEYHAPVEAFRAASHSVRNIEKQAGNIIYSQQRKSSVSIDLGIDDSGNIYFLKTFITKQITVFKFVI